MKNETICNVIQDEISFWKDELETVIENVERTCSSEDRSYYWLSYDGIKKIISLNPYKNLESEQMRRDKKKNIIDSTQCLCDHGCLHLMKLRNSNYIRGNLYNQMKEILIKDWNSKRFLGLHSSEDIPDLTNYDISENSIKCEICTRQLWNDTTKKAVIETTTYFSEINE